MRCEKRRWAWRDAFWRGEKGYCSWVSGSRRGAIWHPPLWGGFGRKISSQKRWGDALVQCATIHPRIRASPCSVQRPSRAHGRVCAECCEASGHSGGVVQRAATRSDVRAGRCRVQRGIPSREMGRCSAHWGIRSRAMRWFSVIYSSVTRASLSQKTRSGRWRIPACLVASKRGSRKRRKTEPKGFLRIFPSAFSDLFVSQADDSREWVSSLGFECPWPRVIFCFLLCRYVAAAKWREYE